MFLQRRKLENLYKLSHFALVAILLLLSYSSDVILARTIDNMIGKIFDFDSEVGNASKSRPVISRFSVSVNASNARIIDINVTHLEDLVHLTIDEVPGHGTW